MHFFLIQLLYYKDFGIKTGQILKIKAIRLSYNIHWIEHKTNKKIHETYNIEEITEILHDRCKRYYY